MFLHYFLSFMIVAKLFLIISLKLFFKHSIIGATFLNALWLIQIIMSVLYVHDLIETAIAFA